MHDRSVPLLFLLLLAGCFTGGQAALISFRARRLAAASRSIASILGCISGVSGKLKGHYGYYGVIFNYRSKERFRYLVGKLWFLALRRRSQRAKRTWEWFDRLLMVFPLPKTIIHRRWFGA